MNSQQLTAIATPFALGAATLAVHFLAPGTASEVGLVCGVLATLLSAVAGVFVPSPNQTRADAAAFQAGVNSVRPPKPTPPLPPGAAGALGFVLAVGLVSAMVATQACSALTPAQSAALEAAALQSGEQIAGCIVANALAGADSEAILLKCDGATLQDIGNVINAFFALQSGDASITITPPPAPTMCTTEQLSHLRKLMHEGGR